MNDNKIANSKTLVSYMVQGTYQLGLEYHPSHLHLGHADIGFSITCSIFLRFTLLPF